MLMEFGGGLEPTKNWTRSDLKSMNKQTLESSKK